MVSKYKHSIHRTDGYVLQLVGAVLTYFGKPVTILAADWEYHKSVWLSRRDSHEGQLDWVLRLRPEVTEVRTCRFTVPGADGQFAVEAEILLARGGAHSRWRAVEIVLKKCPGLETEINCVFGQSVDGVDPKVVQVEQELYES